MDARAVGHQLILDRYRPLEDLGEGGFASVVLAWDTRMQRRVAIKRLSFPADDMGARTPAGLAEARTAAMLTHPNIVTVFDFDTDLDEAFLIMEFVDGTSVAEVLEHVGSLTSDEAASVLADVSAALEFAHDNGVLHLDIKPENVLLTRGGNAKVADFGMAELSSLTGHTTSGGGTFGYMPLEQLRGGATSVATDEWALASMMFELLTGTNPYVADSREEAIINVDLLDPPVASAYSDDGAVDDEIDEVLSVGLSVHADDRFASAAVFADELLPILGDARLGRESLAGIVAELVSEEEPDDEALEPLGLWDRAGGRAGRLVVRGVAAAESAWLAWAGLAPLQVGPAAQAGAAAFVAVAGLLAPGLGIGLGLGCFAVGLAVMRAFLPATVLLVVGGGWWWLFARRSPGAAVLPLAGPALGAVRLGLAQPLIAGFSLPPLRAAAAGFLGGCLTMLASAASSNPVPHLTVWPGYAIDVWSVDLAAGNVQSLVTSPASYIALLAWPAAAATMSVASSAATRVGAIVGVAGGAGLLGGAYLLAEKVAESTGSPLGYESPELAIVLAASSILVALVAALGAPLRAEEEDPLAIGPEEYEDD